MKEENEVRQAVPTENAPPTGYTTFQASPAPVYSTFHPPVAAKAPEPLTWRDWAGPLCALILSAIWCFIFDIDRWEDQQYSLGLGVFAFVYLYFGALMLLRRKEKLDKAGIFYMIAALVLALCRLLYTAQPYGSSFVLLCVTAAATFRLSGHSRYAWFDGRSFAETVKLSCTALFTHFTRPFQAASLAFKHRDKHSGIGRGLLIALPLLLVVLVLLGTSDQVFGGLFTGLLDRLEKFDGGLLIWRIIKTLCVALLIASWFYFLAGTADNKPENKTEKPQRRAQTMLPAAVALDVAYAVFVFIQIRFLFAGKSSAAMAGGWAEYARQGFFQLVAVAIINLVFSLLCSGGARLESKGGKLLRWLDLLMLAFSYVILFSALWRMKLYIQVYGLSMLRLETLWAMLLIAVLLAAAGIILWRRDFHFFKVFIGFGLTAWCLLCLAFPGKIIADYNVNAYQSGRVEQLDAEYLTTLGTDAEPALEKAEYDASWFMPDSWMEWHVSFLYLR